MKLKKITTSAALVACLLGTIAVGADASPVHYGLNVGYAVGRVASTNIHGPAVDFSMFGNFSENWRGAVNIGATFLNGADSNSTIGSNPYMGEVNIQVGYQVIPKLYVYGLAGVAGISTTSNASASNTYQGFEWGGGVSYDWMKYISVYAQYTGQSLSASGLSDTTGSFFTAGLQFHTALF